MIKTTDAKSEDRAGEMRPLHSDELEAIVGGIASFPSHGFDPFGGGYCGTKPRGPHVW